jgi:hypothetical protein
LCSHLLELPKLMVLLGSLSRIRMWCSHCYAEWKERGRIIYDPLIWFLEPVTICPRHQQPLSSQCPHDACRKTQPPLSAYTRCGYCALCNGWLGATVVRNKRQAERGSMRVVKVTDDGRTNAEVFNNELWIVEAVGELLVSSLTVGFLHSGRIYEALHSYFGIELTLKDVRDDLELVLGNNERVSGWGLCRGPLSSQITCLRKICTYLNITLREFLTGDLRNVESRVATFPGTAMVPTCTLKYTNRPRRPFDAKQVELALREVLADNSCPPPTMTAVAARLGYFNGFLYAKLPELSKAIAARHKAYSRAERLAAVDANLSG